MIDKKTLSEKVFAYIQKNYSNNTDIAYQAKNVIAFTDYHIKMDSIDLKYETYSDSELAEADIEYDYTTDADLYDLYCNEATDDENEKLKNYLLKKNNELIHMIGKKIVYSNMITSKILGVIDASEPTEAHEMLALALIIRSIMIEDALNTNTFPCEREISEIIKQTVYYNKLYENIPEEEKQKFLNFLKLL